MNFKVIITLVSIFTSITIMSCSPQFSGVINRPLMDDDNQVFTVLNQIKYSKKNEYKDLLYKKVMPAVKSYIDTSEIKNNLNQIVNDNSYIIEPQSLSSDSTWMFIFVVKPFIKGATNYNIYAPLKQMYGQEMTKKILKSWNECYASKQIVYWSSDNLTKIK